MGKMKYQGEVQEHMKAALPIYLTTTTFYSCVGILSYDPRTRIFQKVFKLTHFWMSYLKAGFSKSVQIDPFLNVIYLFLNVTFEIFAINSYFSTPFLKIYSFFGYIVHSFFAYQTFSPIFGQNLLSPKIFYPPYSSDINFNVD